MDLDASPRWSRIYAVTLLYGAVTIAALWWFTISYRY